MVHRRDPGGEPVVFGNQGALFGNAMTWWDHDTGSVWSQPLGQAILGPREGEKLELFPSTLTTWEGWKDAFPDTEALDVHSWATGFHLHQMAIIVDLGDESAAYDVPALREVGVINDVVAGLEIAVVIDPTEEQRWAVFSRRLNGGVVELAVENSRLIDKVTGTEFDPNLGLGRSGPLSEQDLGRLPGFTSFPDDYFTFFPDGRYWSG